MCEDDAVVIILCVICTISAIWIFHIFVWNMRLTVELYVCISILYWCRVIDRPTPRRSDSMLWVLWVGTHIVTCESKHIMCFIGFIDVWYIFGFRKKNVIFVVVVGDSMAAKVQTQIDSHIEMLRRFWSIFMIIFSRWNISHPNKKEEEFNKFTICEYRQHQTNNHHANTHTHSHYTVFKSFSKSL